jgi:hypothetical protein
MPFQQSTPIACSDDYLSVQILFYFYIDGWRAVCQVTHKSFIYSYQGCRGWAGIEWYNFSVKKVHNVKLKPNQTWKNGDKPGTRHFCSSSFFLPWNPFAWKFYEMPFPSLLKKDLKAMHWMTLKNILNDSDNKSLLRQGCQMVFLLSKAHT